MNHKRKDYISWDEYFMGVSVLSGMRSKDPNTQVGACIVGKDNRILSMGYNDSRMDAAMRIFRGTEKATRLRQNIRLLHTAS